MVAGEIMSDSCENAEASTPTQQTDRMFAVIPAGGTELVKDNSFLSPVCLLVADKEGFDTLAS